jgi:hypothetical protein
MQRTVAIGNSPRNSHPSANCRSFHTNNLAVVLGMSLLAVSAAIAHSDPTTEASQPVGGGKVVALDYYYNHLMRGGKQFGYIWEDTGPFGYSQFGEIWKQDGATLARLDRPPTREYLNRFSIYIIASPTTAQDAPDHHPNLISSTAVDAIVSWVRDGGTLVLFGNVDDKCDLDNLNDLAANFGIVFNHDEISTVPKPGAIVQFSGYPVFDQGLPNYAIFQGVKTVNIPQLCSLEVRAPAQVLLEELYSGPPVLSEERLSSLDRFVRRNFRRNELNPGDPLALLILAAIGMFLGSKLGRTAARNPMSSFFGGGIGLVVLVFTYFVFIDVGEQYAKKLGYLTRQSGNSYHVMAVSQLGAGKAFAVGSPWIYNDYLTVKQDEKPNDNQQIADNLAHWLLATSVAPLKGIDQRPNLSSVWLMTRGN